MVSVADLVGELAWAASSMWFLYALAVYFVVAKALRPLPPYVVVGAAAVLAMSVSGLGIEENNRFSVLVHLVYFLAGAYFPHALQRLAALRPSSVAVLGLTAAYAAAAVVVLHSGLPWSLTAFGASLLGVPLGILAAVRCAPTRAGRALAWVGQRTLRLYVLHLVVLVVLVRLPWSLGERGVPGLVAAIGYPVAMTALVALACFALHAVLVKVGLRWLFELPSPIARRLGSPAAASSSAAVPAAARTLRRSRP